MSLMRTPPWLAGVEVVANPRKTINAASTRLMNITPSARRLERPNVIHDFAQPTLIGETGFGAFAFINHLKIGDKRRLNRVVRTNVQGPDDAADNQYSGFVGDDAATPSFDNQVAVGQHAHHRHRHAIY